MVTNITGFSRSGLSDWFIQRISSIVIAAYLLTIIGFLMTHAQIQFEDWRGLFEHSWMRFFSLLFLLSLLSHAWIGIWTVLTDYIKPVAVRITIQVAVIILLVLCLAWGVEILWRI